MTGGGTVERAQLAQPWCDVQPRLTSLRDVNRATPIHIHASSQSIPVGIATSELSSTMFATAWAQ